ncbi:MAG: SusC/RagA family TonB-linked outer membrane protein [Taibaiella sp.]|jgi:TonB-linked SusC/RagA family outer membrane protein
MKKSLLLFALLLWVGVQAVYAQTKAKGRVIDGESSVKNDPLIGASVRVVGTTAGAQTDMDGNFEVDVPENSNGMIEISSTGYAPQTVKASDNMEVVLKSGNNTLADVVITSPYGPPVTKEKYVGAADVVTGKKIENTPVADVTKAIEGAAPGVQVTNGSGQPGSGAAIQVRGRGSLSASTSPLIVVDGAPYDGDIPSINPMDVANMSILKDAMATSLYGARGSNGVILITTKRGRAGEKPKITVDGKMGVVTLGLPAYDVLTDPKDYYEMAWRGQYNKLITLGYKPAEAGNMASGISSIAEAVVQKLGYNSYRLTGVGDSLQDAYLLDPVTGKLNPNAVLKYKDDWQKAMQRQGLRQDYNFNISGASDKSDYYLSAGYLNEKGYILRSDYSRFTTRLNVNTQATDWLKAGLNVSGTMSTQNGVGTGSANTGNPVWVSLSMAPIYPVYWRDANDNTVIDPATGKTKLDYGNPTKDPDFSMGQRPFSPGNNSLGQLESDQNKTDVKNVIVVPYIEAKLMKGLTFLTRFNASYTSYIGQSYTNRTHGTLIGRGGLQKYSQNDFSYTWNQMLTYQKTFNEAHDLTITAGHENYYLNSSYFLGYITGFASDAFREFTVATGTPTLDSRTDNDRIESYFAVANYAYKGKYLLQANVRRDGLSRFYNDVRWGNFGGAGAAWLINEENFLKDVSWINTLKIKASYGTNGNSGILNDNGTNNFYAYQALYDIARPNGSQPSAIPYSLTSYDLKWETQKAVNVGAEFSLFNQRLSGEINVFNRQTANLYYNVPNPPSTGIISQIKNTGSMYNRGIELNFYITAVKTRNFSWTVNTNWTTYKNRITKLADGIDSVVTTRNTILKPGYDFTSFYLTHSSGVDPKNGDELYSYYDTVSHSMRDTNNFTDVAVNTRSIVGNATPKFSGAITNTFTYKGFELSFLVTYSVGGKYLDGTYQSLMGNALTQIGSTNLSKDILNSWTPENPNATLPRFEWDAKQIGQVSDRFLVDASYINIRNVNLRYALPGNIVKKAGLSSLSAYISGDNIAFFSKRKGMNPQASFDGIVSYPYNPARTIMFGLTVGL